MRHFSFHTPHPTASRQTAGYLLAAVAAASYGTNPIFAIPLYGEGLDVWSVLVLRYATAVLMLGIVALAHHPKALLMSGREYGAAFVMGLLMVGSSATLFESYHYLSAGIASTLLFFYPVMVAVIMAVCYGERLSRRAWLCLAVAFLGVFTLSASDTGEVISLRGLALCMLSSLSYAAYLIYIRRGPLRTAAPMAVTFYVMLASLAALVVAAGLNGGVRMPQSTTAWMNAAGLGLFPTIISLYATSQAIARIGSTGTAIFGALEPLTAVVLGIVVLGETLTLRPAIGMFLIFASVTALVNRGGTGKRKRADSKVSE